MPELPEVEICGRQLARWSAGRRVVGWQVLDPAAIRTHRSTRPADGHPEGTAELAPLVGRVPGALARHGKRLGWSFGDRALLLHLGMTGRWVRRCGVEVPAFGKLGLTLDDGATLWFTDPRRFGCVVPVAREGLAEALAEGLGPDALHAGLTGPQLRRLMGVRGALKQRLMDQRRLAGVGNIQASETLFRAGLHPDRVPESLSDAEWSRLATSLRVQLRHTLDLTDGDEVIYVSDAGGDNPFEVYGRQGRACPRCGASIVRSTHGGRATFCCPRCQPLDPTTRDIDLRDARGLGH